MRIASTQYHSTMNAALQDASARAQEMLERIASGNKLSVPSDDPVTAVDRAQSFTATALRAATQPGGGQWLPWRRG